MNLCCLIPASLGISTKFSCTLTLVVQTDGQSLSHTQTNTHPYIHTDGHTHPYIHTDGLTLTHTDGHTHPCRTPTQTDGYSSPSFTIASNDVSGSGSLVSNTYKDKTDHITMVELQQTRVRIVMDRNMWSLA